MEMPNIAKTLQKQPAAPDKKVSDDSNQKPKESFSEAMDKEVQGNNDKTNTAQGEADKMEKPENQETPNNVVIPLFPNQMPQPEIVEVVPEAAVKTVQPVVGETMEANPIQNQDGEIKTNMPNQIAEPEQVVQAKTQPLSENGNKANVEQPQPQMQTQSQPQTQQQTQIQTPEAVTPVSAAQPEAQAELGSQTEPNQKNVAAMPIAEETIEVKAEKPEGSAVQFSQVVTGEAKPDTQVKQVQTPVPADTAESQVDLQKLSQTMVKEMAKGKTEMEIWLEPAHLGKLAIKVAYEGGKAAVSIICTNEKTMELISQNAKNLGNIIDQHMGTKTVVVIEHPEADYLQQHNNQQNQSQQQQNNNQEAKQQENSNDADSLTFLQQLRLGLA